MASRRPQYPRLWGFSYAAASWEQPWRVIVKAEVMAALTTHGLS
jgi:hypothetical protein